LVSVRVWCGVCAPGRRRCRDARHRRRRRRELDASHRVFRGHAACTSDAEGAAAPAWRDIGVGRPPGALRPPHRRQRYHHCWPATLRRRRRGEGSDPGAPSAVSSTDQAAAFARRGLARALSTHFTSAAFAVLAGAGAVIAASNRRPNPQHPSCASRTPRRSHPPSPQTTPAASPREHPPRWP
jgi:hypothetical protein